MKPKTGLHRGIPADEYHDEWDAVNCSTLKLFAGDFAAEVSDAHARAVLTSPPKDSAAFRVGRAVHAAVGEPEEFAKGWVAAPKLNRRTKDGRKAWADFEAANSSREVLTADEFAQVNAIKVSVLTHPIGRRLYKEPGEAELSFVWEREVEGFGPVLCKGRADRFTVFEGTPVVVDLKTTENASPGEDGFVRQVGKYNMAMQAAWYLDGLNAVAPAERRFLFLAVEKKPPFAVCVHELDQWSLESGRIQCERLLARYCNAMKTETWAGYPNVVNQLELPPWTRRKMEGDSFDDIFDY